MMMPALPFCHLQPARPLQQAHPIVLERLSQMWNLHQFVEGPIACPRPSHDLPLVLAILLWGLAVA